jgi:hypothetical protein
MAHESTKLAIANTTDRQCETLRSSSDRPRYFLTPTLNANQVLGSEKSRVLVLKKEVCYEDSHCSHVS